MILVLNTGSSSLKFAIFEQNLTMITSGLISGVGGAGDWRLGASRSPVTTSGPAEAIALMCDSLEAAGFRMSALTAAGHRVVHGGDRSAPVQLTPETRALISDAATLAPMHNPFALIGIDALTARAPGLPQFASFDTAFHADQPALATTYALPAAIRARGIRRYGFHGLSYASLVDHLGANLPDRLLAFHLGAGVSVCAIRAGKSLATTMGYSPLSGPPMATRVGDIDANAVLALAAQDGIPATAALLSQQSGLLGLSGISSDMRILLADPGAQAAFAVDHFCTWVARQAASLLPALGGVDAFAFTGGIGENAAPVRDRILAHLAFLGPKPVHVIAAAEERRIAQDSLDLLRSDPGP